ncbi:hypothetical protein GW17_00041384 [Ensete ventricosum]|nr:hypothetical protein GW17_00041384 [Ensete ventricosum]
MATYKGATYCGQGPLQRGSQLRPGPARKCGARPWLDHKGSSQVRRPWLEGGQLQLDAHKGWQQPVASRGRAYRGSARGGAAHGSGTGRKGAAPWQGDCRRARAAVTYSGAAMAGSAMRVTEEG